MNTPPDSRIHYTKPSITALEVGYATDAAANGWGERCYDYIHRFERQFREHLGSRFAIATSSGTGALHLGMAGLGIGQITSYQAQQHLQNGALVRLMPEWTQPPLPVYVVYPPNRHLSAKVRAFVDWAAELFQRETHLQRTQ